MGLLTQSLTFKLFCVLFYKILGLVSKKSLKDKDLKKDSGEIL